MSDRRAYQFKIVFDDDIDREGQVRGLYRQYHDPTTVDACPVCGDPVVETWRHPRGTRFRHSDKIGDQCCAVQVHSHEPPIGMYVGDGALFDGEQGRLL